MILHGILMFLCLVAWAPYVFLLNIPIALWHARRYGCALCILKAFKLRIDQQCVFVLHISPCVLQCVAK